MGNSWLFSPAASRLEPSDRERAFLALAEASERMTWILRQDGRCAFVNRAFTEQMGLDASAALDLGWLDALSPSDRASFLPRWRDLAETDQAFELDLILQDGSGVARSFHVRLEPLHRGEEPRRFLATARPAAASLTPASELTRRVLDSLFAFVGVLEPDGTLLEANEAPLAAAGLTLSDVRGKKFWDCFWWSYDPAIQAQLEDACARAAAGETVRYDVPVRVAADGRLDIDFQIAPMRDATGRVTHLIPSAVDIADRKRAEQAMAWSEARLRRAQKAGNVGTWEADLVSGQTHWSDTMWTIYGRSPEPDTNPERVFRDSLHPDDARRLDVWQAQAQRGEVSLLDEEIRIRRPDGTWRWIQTTAEVVRDDGDRPVRMAGVNIDITERVQAAERLRESENRARELARALEERNELLEALFEHAPAAFALLSPTPPHPALTHNQAYERFLAPHGEGGARRPEDEAAAPRPVPSLGEHGSVLEEVARTGAARALSEVPYDPASRPSEPGSSLPGEIPSDEAGEASSDPSWWNWNVAPVVVAGELVGLAHAAIEVTEAVRARKALEAEMAERERAAAALTAQTEMMAALIDTIPVLLCIWNPTLERFQFNRCFREVLGWDEADGTGGDFMEKFYPDPEYRAEVEAFMRGLRGWKDLETTAKDGAQVPISWANIRLSNETLVGIGVDLRPRLRAEADLRRQRELLQAIIDNAAAAIYAKDLDGRFILSNRHQAEMLGKAPSDLLGESDSSLGFSEAEVKVFRSNDQAVLDAGRSMSFEEHIQVGRVDRTYLSVKFPLRDADSAIYGVCGISTDITERKQTERALRESEDKFRALAEAMPQFVWSTDHRGYHDYFNEKWYQYTGMPRTGEQGWRWREYLHPDDVAASARMWRRSLATGEPYSVEYRFRRASDGAYRWFMGRALPVRDASGRIVRWFGTSTDIHDLKVAEAALREADRRKDEFVAMLAHELRNPLAPVRTAAELIRAAGSQGPVVDRARDVISRQVQHMTRLIDDLLDVSRVARGLIDLDRSRIDLSDVVRQTVEDYRSSLESSGLEIRVHFPPEPVWIIGDRVRLAQAIGNLLHNAGKFTERGGRISAGVERDAATGEALVLIEDTGVGIPPELLPRLFESFSQADQGIDRAKGGLGLGLALVRGLVELHGGRTAVHSDGPGRGSAFTLRLPTAEVDRDESSNGQPAAARSPSPEQLRIVVIEDNQDAAEMLKLMLSMKGHEVDVAFDGQSGLMAAEVSAPDVVICDLGLPGGVDGFDVARSLRRGRQPVALVALSGYAREEDRREALEAGFDFHLAKPVHWQSLEEILLQARSRRERAADVREGGERLGRSGRHR